MASTGIKCRVCGHALRDPESISLGVGPKCAEMAASPDQMMFRAEWFSELFDDVLVIFDRGSGSLTVSSDAPRVIAAEAERLGRSMPRLVICRDSNGDYVRIRHRKGVFGGVARIAAPTLREALSTIIHEAA